MKYFILLLSLISCSALSKDEGESMQVIYEIRGSAFFYEMNDEYYGEVLVGRNGGNWAILFKLSEDETKKYLNQGFDYFHVLDKLVASSIDEYGKRAIYGSLGGKSSDAIKVWRKSNPL